MGRVREKEMKLLREGNGECGSGKETRRSEGEERREGKERKEGEERRERERREKRGERGGERGRVQSTTDLVLRGNGRFNKLVHQAYD